MYQDEIIDAHMHIWDLDHGHYPWLKGVDKEIEKLIGDYKKIRRNFLIADYEALVKSHRVVKCVHIEANAEPTKALHETEWLQKIADHHGFPHAIIASANLVDPDIANVLKDHCQYPNVRGIRQVLFHELESEAPDLINDPHWQKGLKALEAQILSFDIAIFGHQIPAAVQLAKEYPNVSFVLEHLGFPRDLSDRGFISWKHHLARLAEHENVYLKLSGIGLVFRFDDQENIERFIHAGVEIFGEDRCIFGSNIPPDTLFFSYDKLIEIFKRTFTRYSLNIQRKLFYENAKEFYDL